MFVWLIKRKETYSSEYFTFFVLQELKGEGITWEIEQIEIK